MIKKIGKGFSIICLIVTIVLLLLLSYITIIKVIEKNNKNFESKINTYTIIGKSMVPNLNAGDIIVTIKNNIYNINDIITFFYTDSYYNEINITHRIVDITEKDNKIYYTTKGDNNDFKDTFSIENKNIIGKMLIKLPKLGNIDKLISNPPIWLIIIFIPCIGLAIYNINKIFKKENIKKEQVFE